MYLEPSRYDQIESQVIRLFSNINVNHFPITGFVKISLWEWTIWRKQSKYRQVYKLTSLFESIMRFFNTDDVAAFHIEQVDNSEIKTYMDEGKLIENPVLRQHRIYQEKY